MDSAGPLPTTSPKIQHTIRHQASAPFPSLSSAFQHHNHSPSRPISTFFGAQSPPHLPQIRTHDLPPAPSRPSGTLSGGVIVSPGASLAQFQDPRDHTILEAIYNAMHESKFINLNPLSIIQNYLVLHFSNIGSHSPLMFLAPHRPSDRIDPTPLCEGTRTTGLIDALELNLWGRKMLGASPSIIKKGSVSLEKASRSEPNHATTYTPHHGDPSQPISKSLPLEQLAAATAQKAAVAEKGKQSEAEMEKPYCIEDWLAVDAFRHIPRITMAPIKGPSGAGSVTIKTFNGLPNKTFMYDVHHAGVCLSISVADVLGCVEEMWEFVKAEDATADRGIFEELVEKYAA